MFWDEDYKQISHILHTISVFIIPVEKITLKTYKNVELFSWTYSMKTCHCYAAMAINFEIFTDVLLKLLISPGWSRMLYPAVLQTLE